MICGVNSIINSIMVYRFRGIVIIGNKYGYKNKRKEKRKKTKDETHKTLEK